VIHGGIVSFIACGRSRHIHCSLSSPVTSSRGSGYKAKSRVRFEIWQPDGEIAG